MKMNYRIGLSGPSGSGKTTLAHFLENLLDVKFMPGSASIINDDEAKTFLANKYGYEPKGHKNVINLSNSNPEFGYDFQTLLLNSRSNKLLYNSDFVTDRTPVDNLVYFLMQCSHNQREDVCDVFISNAIKAALNGLTHLILVKPNDGWTENNDSRVANNYFQQMSFAVFVHVYERYFEPYFKSHNIPSLILDEWDLKYRKDSLRALFNK